MKVYELPPLHFAVTVDGILVQTGEAGGGPCLAWVRVPDDSEFPRQEFLSSKGSLEPPRDDFFNEADLFWVKSEVKEIWPIPVVDIENPK